MPADLLRRHETRRADHHPRPRHGRRVQRASDTEVDHLRAGVSQDDIGRLEIPVHDAGRVDDGQRLGQPGGQAVQHPGTERPVAADVFGQRRTVGVLGDHERPVCLGVGLDHPHRARALDPHQRRYLMAETAPEIQVVGQLRAQHLHRDRAAIPGAGIHAQVHHAHPARAEPGEQPVTADLHRIASPKRHASQNEIPPPRPHSGVRAIKDTTALFQRFALTSSCAGR